MSPPAPRPEDELLLAGEVETFPGPGGWTFVRVPAAELAELDWPARRGLVPVTARLGTTSWDTSLMPFGDGTTFLPLAAKVRRAEDVRLGDEVEVRMHLRLDR